MARTPRPAARLPRRPGEARAASLPARAWPLTLAALALLLALAGCGRSIAPPYGVATPPPVGPPVRMDGPTVKHRLARGETLWALSQRYSVPVSAIVARNAIRDPRRLPVGMELLIPVPDAPPAAEPTAPAPSPPAPAPQRVAATTPQAAPRPSPKPRAAPPAGPTATAAPRQPAPGPTATATPREPAPAPTPEPGLDLSAVDATLARAESDLHAARFEEALAGASRARGMLDTVAGDPAAKSAVVRTELLTATVLIALGRDEAARESLARALDADPDLTLDPARTSPKVVEVFEGMRARP